MVKKRIELGLDLDFSGKIVVPFRLPCLHQNCDCAKQGWLDSGDDPRDRKAHRQCITRIAQIEKELREIYAPVKD